MLSFTAGCGDPKDKTEPKMQRFYSKEEPGMWDGQADTHVPKIEFKPGEKRKFTVTVPLVGTANPPHRIEAIFLLAVNGTKETEIAATRFNELVSSPTADFELPEADDKNRDTQYYIIAKCNVHDMWRVPVQAKSFF